MTPKEKAEELYNKFNPHCLIKNFYGDDIERFSTKQCALIAADEIIDTFIPKTKPDFTCYEIEYWKEVKQEIELL